jgi:hypothetical protein
VLDHEENHDGRHDDHRNEPNPILRRNLRHESDKFSSGNKQDQREVNQERPPFWSAAALALDIEALRLFQFRLRADEFKPKRHRSRSSFDCSHWKKRVKALGPFVLRPLVRFFLLWHQAFFHGPSAMWNRILDNKGAKTQRSFVLCGSKICVSSVFICGFNNIVT